MSAPDSSANPVELTEGLSPTEALAAVEPPASTAVVYATGDEAAEPRYGFLVGNYPILVPSGMVAEVVEAPNVYAVPRAPVWLRGIINVRGRLVPVVDPGRLFGAASGAKGEERLLMLGQATDAVCIVIDALPRLVSCEHESPQLPPLAPLLSSHVSKAYVQEATVWLELDVRKLLQTIASRGH